MTDNEIIKALEGKLPLGIHAIHEAIDLIDRQKAEIEKLQDEIVTWKRISDNKTKALFEYCDVIDELHKKITRLEETKNRLSYNLQAVLDERADHSEAIKEFAERLKVLCRQARFSVTVTQDLTGIQRLLDNIAVVDENDIDNLVKEMVGEG